MKEIKRTGYHFIHGHTAGQNLSPTYMSWKAMKRRCKSKYKSRNITVCPQWENDFENFLRDVGERPQGKTLDRINNEGNYEPSNCRWATNTEQARNRRPRRKK